MTETNNALRLAQELDAVPETGADPQTIQEAAAELRRLHAYCQELESHLILDCMNHVQNPAENEHVAGDVSKNGAELNMSAQQPAPASQQEAQEPVAWYVTGCGRLLDEDEAKAEARHIGGTARAIPVYTAPQPSPAAQGDALDTMRLDWLDADESRCVFHLGKSWYTRPSYGLPYRKRASLREAIDAARKEMS